MECNFETLDNRCKLADQLCSGKACIFMKMLPKINKIDKELRAKQRYILGPKNPNNKLPRKQPDGASWRKKQPPMPKLDTDNSDKQN